MDSTIRTAAIISLLFAALGLAQPVCAQGAAFSHYRVIDLGTLVYCL